MAIRRLFEYLVRRRVLIQTAFVVIVTAIYVWLIQDQSTWVKGFENNMLQLRWDMTPPREAPKDVVIIGVADTTFDVLNDVNPDTATRARLPELTWMKANTWPWDRRLWGLLTERLMGAGAKFVAYDLVFNQYTEGDEECGKIFQRYTDPEHPENDQVVIASQLGGSAPGSQEMIIEPEGNLTKNAGGEDIVGIIRLNEEDGLVRSIQNQWDLNLLERLDRMRNPGVTMPPHSPFSLAWMAAKRVLHQSPQSDPEVPMLINYYPPIGETPQTITTLHLEEVLLHWNTIYDNGAYFKNKVVFVGPIGEAHFNDQYNTTAGYLSGVEIEATAFANLENHEWQVPAPDWVVLALAVGLGALALIVSLYVHSVMVKMSLFVSLGAFFLVVTQHLYWSDLFVTPVAGAAFILVSVGVFGTLYDFVLGKYEQQRMLGMFESMVSPGVAGLLLSHRGDFEKRLVGQRQEVVILFGDIRNFTSWSEKVGPEALVAQLNEHLSAMVNIVQEEGGTVQKYIGDALMVAWGDVRAQPSAEGAEHAVRSALRMQAALKTLNEGWQGQTGRHQLSLGIGINLGLSVVGRIGHPRRQEFTVMGDAVNLAARLESATKEYRQPILVGESIYEITKDLFIYRQVDKMLVKGKSQAVKVYTPLGDAGTPLPPGLATYETALDKYYKRDFTGAAELFRAANDQMGGDFLCAIFLERCAYYQQSPPPMDWEGIWVLKEK